MRLVYSVRCSAVEAVTYASSALVAQQRTSYPLYRVRFSAGVTMKELLLNSRASWAKRHNTEPATAFYNTDTGHNKSMGARLKTTPQRCA